MSILSKIKVDTQRFVSDTNGFASEAIFTNLDTLVSVTISGIHSKINQEIGTDGTSINSKKAHISVAEKALTDLSYSIRNEEGEVTLRGHKVQVRDSTGTLCSYVVKDWYPDETVGLIVCILEDYE